MRLQELVEKQALTGSYVCAKFDEDTVEALAKLQEIIDVPNPVPAHEFHATIVYSQATIHWRAEHDLHHEATPVGFQVWDTQSETRCLVLLIESEYLRTRFELATARGADHAFDAYRPHVTLSYDVGPDFDATDLSVPDLTLVIDCERYEPLNPDYSA